MRDGVAAAVAAVPRAQRADELGRGAGGDLTVAIDRAAEDAALGRARAPSRASGEGFTVVSEEIGERSFGGGGRWRVVIDPIDGSLNAKRGLPLYALSVAVADGPSMARRRARLRLRPRQRRGVDRAARRRRDGRRRRRSASSRPLERLQLVALEATRPEQLAPAAAALTGDVERVRVLGSLALALCHLADGRVDAVASLRPRGARAIDIAAGAAAGARGGLARRAAGRARPVRSGAARPRRALARRRGARRRARWRASPALLGIGPAGQASRIRGSMPS